MEVKDSCKYAQELTATGAVISAVEANPLAIGYASLSAVGDTVKMVTVGGVECSEETVKDGSYEVQRPFVFVTNKSVTLSEQAQALCGLCHQQGRCRPHPHRRRCAGERVITGWFAGENSPVNRLPRI